MRVRECRRVGEVVSELRLESGLRLETWVDSVELRLESGSPGQWGCEWVENEIVMCECESEIVWERGDRLTESRGQRQRAMEHRDQRQRVRESWRWEWENESVRSENWDRDRVLLFFPKWCVLQLFFFFFLNFGLNQPVRCRYRWLRPIQTDSAWIGANQPDSTCVGPTLRRVGAYRTKEKKEKGHGLTHRQRRRPLHPVSGHVGRGFGGRNAASVLSRFIEEVLILLS